MKHLLHQLRGVALAAIIVGAVGVLPASARTHAGLVTITSGPAARTTSATATFVFSINASFANTQFFCELDGKASPGTCTSPKTYSGLAVGEHTFKVSAYAGEIGLGDATWTWLVDSTSPNFVLKLDTAELPLTTRPGFTSTKPVRVQVIRLGGSKGPLQIQNATTSGSAQVLTIQPGLKATVVPDNATNPSTLNVSLSATPLVKTEIGKSFTLTALPTSPAVGPVARSVSIPYAVVDEYDLVVRGLDITQGIQPDQGLPPGRTAAYGGVTLVKDKRTVVRVYAAVAAPFGKQVSDARIFLDGWRYKDGFAQQSLGSSLVSGRVSLSGGPDAPVSLSMLQTAKPTATFVLPPEWTEKGPIVLTARVLPPSLFQPSAESECTSPTCAVNNDYKVVDIPFVDTGYVEVWPVYLKLRGGLSPCCPNGQFANYLPSVPLDAAQRMLPLADGELRTNGDDWRAEYDVTNTVKLAMLTTRLFGCIDDCSLNDWLVDYSEDLKYHQVCPGTSTCPDVIMSMIDDTPVPSPWHVNGVSKGTISPLGLAYSPSHTLVNLRRPLSSVAHELGHSLGLKHASWGCDGAADGQKGDLAWPDPFGYIHGIGLDIRDDTSIYDGTGNGPAKKSTTSWPPLVASTVFSTPGSWYDFMSYCAGTNEWDLHAPNPQTPQQGVISPWKRTDAWMSSRNWKKVQEFLAFLKSAHAVTSGSAFRSSLAAEEATLSVRGFVHDGHVVLTRIRSQAGQPSARTQSDYELVLLASKGAEIARWPLTVTSSEGHGAASTFLTADVPLDGTQPGALPANLTALDVVSHGTVLDHVTRSASRPDVHLLGPTAGARVGTDQTTAVTWKATDADADAALEIAVDYSTDDGNGWSTVYQGPNTGRAEIPSARLSASDRARIRLRVSDGFDEASDTSGRLDAVGRPPGVRVLSPGQGELSRPDATLYLSATAYDDAGRFLDGDRIAWYDGPRLVSHGRLGSVTGLAPGAHLLRAVARDDKGREGRATVRVRILATAPAIIVSRAPAAVSPREHSVRFQVACTIASTLSITAPTAGSIHRPCSPSSRWVFVPLRPGHARVRLVLQATAHGSASETILAFPMSRVR